MKKSFKFLSLAVAAVTLAACNASQDSGGTDSRVNMKGLAVDGRVANALVWVDRNGNGELDRDFEPFARTDSRGHFSISETGENYCADSAAPEFRHCLRYGSSDGKATIRIRGGIDISTGERLKADMALNTTMSDASQASDPQVTSPITSLLSEADATERAQLETALGLSGDYVRTDFSDAATPEEADMLANAMAIQSLQDLLLALGHAEAEVTGRSHGVGSLFLTAPNSAKVIIPTVTLANRQITEFTRDDLLGLFQKAGVPEDKRESLADDTAKTVTLYKRIAEATPEQRKRRIRSAEVGHKLNRTSNVDGNTTARDRLTEINNAPDDLDDVLADGDFDLRSVSEELSNGETLADAANNAKLGAFGELNQWFVLQVDSVEQDGADEVEPGSYIAINFDGTESGGAVYACAYARPVDSDDGDEEVLESERITGQWGKVSDGRLSLDLKYSRFERSGQLIARAADNKYRLTTEDDDGEQQDGFAVSNTAAEGRLNATDDKFSKDGACADLHEELDGVEGIGWTSAS